VHRRAVALRFTASALLLHITTGDETIGESFPFAKNTSLE